MKHSKMPTVLCDFYKISHRQQYPKQTELIYSTWTARSNKYFPKSDKVVFFGLQGFIKQYLIDHFNENFFNRDKEEVVEEYKRVIKHTLGIEDVDATHIADLHDLGYLPIKIKALKEGTLVPIKVPMMTVENTHPKFFWLTNYLETLISVSLWLACTNATIAHTYRKLLDEYAIKTTGSTEGVDFQGHDFSMRGMGSLEASIVSGASHLLSFFGTDTIPSILYLEEYYNANIENEMVGASIPATEHSVMSAYGQTDEFKLFKHLMTNVYPTGFFSVVSDTWDFWKVVGEYLPKLKKEILSRDGRVVIRPDSGDPVDILVGTMQGQIKDAEDVKIDSSVFVVGNTFEDRQRNYEDLRDIVWNLWFDTTNSDRDEGQTLFKFVVKTTDGKYFKIKAEIISFEYYESTVMDRVEYTVLEEITETLESKGLIECLWDIFGGTITEQGYKVLDPHIGAIYGDSITLERAEAIVKGLEAKGFASTNVVFGIGSYTYQMQTRDTLGHAMKSTYAIVDGEERFLSKDPKTDDGTKKSLKGRVHVGLFDGKLKATDGLTKDMYVKTPDFLEDVFVDGELLREQSLSEIRELIKSQK